MTTKKDTFKATQLDRNHNGLWQEILIRNASNKTVVIIDEKNNRTLLPPETDYALGEQGIEFIHGCFTGKRASVDKNHVVTYKKMTFKRTFAPIWQFDAKGYYHEDLNILVSTAINNLGLLHPDSKETYSQKLQQLTDVLESEENEAQVKITINDPKGRRSQVYLCLGGRVVTVKCTSLESSNNKASMGFCVGAKEGNGLQYELDIEELYKAGAMLIQKTFPLGIGLTPTDATLAYDKYVNEYDSLVQDTIDSRVNEIRDDFHHKEIKFKDQISTLKQQKSIDDLNYKNYLDEEQIRTNKINHDLETERNARSQWEELYKNLCKAKELDEKRFSSYEKTMDANAKTKSSESTRENERIKLMGNIVKVGIPIATVLLTAYFKYKSDN